MSVVSTTLSILLAVVFLSLGLAKLFGAKPIRETSERIGVPFPFLRFVGVLEVSAAVGLLIGLAWKPLGVAAAIGLTLLMAGGYIAHARAKEPAQGLPAAVLAVLAGGAATALTLS
ncbi:hypothetical protein GCM10010112_78840 [Actinoplanes lobatus]|uniref:Putative membrane protein YphA (DoxX/SURF4 family) n=1 Tax=Actinoplanes lobatus TaxID=113568 RepID=A0A7W7HI01_9ACTN|nr:DoxX family protein [Actinoplanes lobatus]MBB4750908.1 putative membrane protein YphA (DoxX/SURF4 family) [Actinoplanes lobatus]GGN92053.1 hypothetical protein GCM10010112_78840 [Actinoplanes lobatus]GIE44461.1 hypothetical protein Alo02nite_73590 [Actinoplanes lobatus]